MKCTGKAQLFLYTPRLSCALNLFHIIHHTYHLGPNRGQDRGAGRGAGSRRKRIDCVVSCPAPSCCVFHDLLLCTSITIIHSPRMPCSQLPLPAHAAHLQAALHQQGELILEAVRPGGRGSGVQVFVARHSGIQHLLRQLRETGIGLRMGKGAGQHEADVMGGSFTSEMVGAHPEGGAGLSGALGGSATRVAVNGCTAAAPVLQLMIAMLKGDARTSGRGSQPSASEQNSPAAAGSGGGAAALATTATAAHTTSSSSVAPGLCMLWPDQEQGWGERSLQSSERVQEGWSLAAQQSCRPAAGYTSPIARPSICGGRPGALRTVPLSDPQEPVPRRSSAAKRPRPLARLPHLLCGLQLKNSTLRALWSRCSWPAQGSEPAACTVSPTEYA